MLAALAVRWQTSRANSRVRRASLGCAIRARVCATRSSESKFRNGDCSNCADSPCRSVPSKTGSPVVLVYSARTMVSFSVRRCVVWRERKYNAPAIATATIIKAAGTRTFQSFLPATGTSAAFTALDDGDGASAGEEPDSGDGGWETGEPLSCATATDPELAGTPCRDSVSRFSRFRSARIPPQPDSAVRDLSP